MATTRILFLLALSCFLGCRGGIRLGPIGFGADIGAGPSAVDAELALSGIRIERHRVDIGINDDLSSDTTITTTRTLATAAGVRAGQRASLTFDPKTQSLDLALAYVLHPDGTRIPVTAENVFTRPSEAAQNAPGFVSTSTTTVVFPQLRVGSQTHTQWRLVGHAEPLLGFDYVYRPRLTLPVEEAIVTVSYPASVPLRTGQRGGFDVVTTEDGDRRTVTARLSGYPGLEPEAGMVDPVDVVPVFVASTSSGWAEIGARFRELCEPRIERTPDIVELAERIVGSATGLAAARAIHNWVCRNVHYVAVYLNATDGWVPNSSIDVLRNGYGDCKDHYVLFAALCRARGIEVEAGLVNWDRSYAALPLPTPLQFDHCIAWLPQFDVWANPTDPFADLGVLDIPLSGKLVALATAEGAVRTTPSGRAADNRYGVRHVVTLHADGHATGSSEMTFHGRPSARFRAVLAQNDPGAVARDLLLQTPEGGAGDLETTDPTDLDVPLRCSGTWASANVYEPGDLVYFTPPAGVDFVSARAAYAYVTANRRQLPLVGAAVEISWSYEIELPDGYSAARVPAGRDLESDAGAFSSTYRVGDDDNKVHVERRLRIARDVFPASDYAALRDLLYATINDAREVFVLSREL